MRADVCNFVILYIIKSTLKLGINSLVPRPLSLILFLIPLQTTAATEVIQCHSNSDIPPVWYPHARYPKIICSPVPHILSIYYYDIPDGTP